MPIKPEWEGKHYAFYTNRECEYFPCHKSPDPEHFNCLFCYCPLYALGKNCGGNFRYYGDIKDCSECSIPHQPQNYGYITGKYSQIVELTKKLELLK